MSAVTMHWAAAYLGKPWRRGACGPNEFYCWGLVQHLCKRRLGIDMPAVAVGTREQQFGAIFEAARGNGWHQVQAKLPRADDIVLMRNRFGDRHCGFVVEADGRLGVLHADGHDTPRGPVGEVVFEPFEAAIAGGYSDLEIWRHA